MKNRLIPKTTLSVSPISLGTMTFGTPVGETDAIKMMHYAYDKGINFIDTANMYEGYSRVVGSAGEVAEQVIGKAVESRRSDFILATKVGMKVGDTPEAEGTSPAAIRKQLDLSLARMQTDYTDIYYLHRPDPGVPLADILGALKEVIDAGKALYYGISNYSAEQTKELLAVADANGLPRPVIHQPEFSLLKPDILNDLLPLCKREHIGVAPYRFLASGLLTGKYRRGVPVPLDSRKSEKEGWVPELTDELFDKLEAIESDAKKESLTMTEYTYVWTLRQPAVVSLVAGIRKLSQIDDAVAAASKAE